MFRVLILSFALSVGFVLAAPAYNAESSAGDRIGPDAYQQSACDPRFQSC